MKVNSLPSVNSYQQIAADLDAFDARLLSTEQRKGGYITVSELKSFSWKIRRKLESAGMSARERIIYAGEKIEDDRAVAIKVATENISALNAFYLVSLGRINEEKQTASELTS